MSTAPAKVAFPNPFDLGNDAAYAAWRAVKLTHYPRSSDELVVSIEDPCALSPAEHAAVLERILRSNMAIYELTSDVPQTTTEVRAIGRQFGLARLDSNLYADEDAVSALSVVETGRRGEYIPYTNQRLSWHTDGYYNSADQQIRSIVMHCVRAAAEGGESALLDHEICYIRLRDENPDFVAVLMQPDVMSIPANVEDGVELRPAHTGPVFSLDSTTRSLHMRYTARTRSIHWRSDPLVQQARECLTDIMGSETSGVLKHRLRPGQGVICNNVLHSRTAFRDDADSGQTRLLFRARYYDRVHGTEGVVGED